jgi:hypothetical protein
LQIKEISFWEKEKINDSCDPCITAWEDSYSNFHKLLKKIDFLLVESNDIEGLIDETFTTELSELQIRRAYAEMVRLQKYYHFRRGGPTSSSKGASKAPNDK